VLGDEFGVDLEVWSSNRAAKAVVKSWLRSGAEQSAPIWEAEINSLPGREVVLPANGLLGEGYFFTPERIESAHLRRIRDLEVTAQSHLFHRGMVLDAGNLLPSYVSGLTEAAVGSRSSGRAPLPVSSAFILLHYTYKTYGHFLLEMAPKIGMLSLLRQAMPKLPVLLMPDTPDFVRGWLDLLLPGANVLVVGSEGVLVQDAFMSDMLATHYFGGVAFRDFLRRSHKRAKGRATEPPVGKKLWVSRRQRHARAEDFRRLLNSEQLEAALCAHGFEAVEPENLSLAEQVLTYRQADVVVGELSSGLHNTVFCKPGTKVVQLNPFNSAQRNLSLCLGHRLTSVLPDDGHLRAWPPEFGIDPGFTVEPERLLKALG
jgi:hypothetical protein